MLSETTGGSGIKIVSRHDFEIVWSEELQDIVVRRCLESIQEMDLRSPEWHFSADAGRFHCERLDRLAADAQVQWNRSISLYFWDSVC